MKSLIARQIGRIGSNVALPFELVFSDGSVYRNRAETPAFSLRLRDRLVEFAVAAFGHVGMLDGYFDGRVDLDGDLRAVFEAIMYSGLDSATALVRIRNRWHEVVHSNASWLRAKENARFHYGLGTEFYQVWLDDPLMMYTCAYWREGTRTLEEAQANKIEHVCRKLRLSPGESVVDIGCGFGGFIYYAAGKYGVHVTGVNTTTEQVAWVASEIERRNLATSAKVVETDFRDAFATFDKVVSIGVLEHAGRDQLKEVIAAHAKFLKPGGLGVLHFISHVSRRETEFFIREHVFPGGWIPSLADVIVAMEECGLEVIDIENLRRHYALTLDAWAERFDRNWECIRALDPVKFNERFRRIWRTYLIGSAEMFRSPAALVHLFQIVFSKGNVSDKTYPMSRAFLYSDRQPEAFAGER
jgi:cyclopropane-fatty-acyl-phospholipid synthase